MSDNKFDQLLEVEIAKSVQNKAIFNQCSDYLRFESINHNGTKPSLFFSKKDSRIINDFIKSLERRHFPNSIKLFLKKPFPTRTLTQTEINFGPSKRSLRNKILGSNNWKTVWSGYGYQIGVISTSRLVATLNSLPVYVCNDGLLRCQRNFPIFSEGTTSGYGVGNIPEFSKTSRKLHFIIGRFNNHLIHDELLSGDFEEMELMVLLKQIILNSIMDLS